MGMRLNPAWVGKMRDKIMEFRMHGGPDIDETLTWNTAAQSLIKMLAESGVSFRVIPLGAGVNRITTKVDVCPKCNGTGKC